jgi:hypothetical protein
MDVLDVCVTSGQSIARGGTLFPVGRVAIVVLVNDVLDVFVTSGQSIARCGTLFTERESSVCSPSVWMSWMSSSPADSLLLDVALFCLNEQ